MSRPDFRSSNQIRPPSCSLGVVTEANGSCHFSQGNTEAIASVYGPTQPKQLRHEKYDEASLEISFSISGSARTSALSGAAGGENIQLSRIEKSCAQYLRDSLRSSLHLQDYPRKIIFIKVCVLQDDGAMISVALNAASLALLNAGLSMQFLPISVTIFFPQNKSENNPNFIEECSLDPNSEEEKSAECSLIFTINPSESFEIEKKTNKILINSNEKIEDGEDRKNDNRIDRNENEKYGIIHMLGTGNFSVKQLNEAIVLVKKSGFILHEFVRRIIQDKLEINN